jgi:hypothetical protein
MPLNVRFGQPGRAAGTEQVDRLYPGASFPFAYSRETDPLTGAKGGILDRCSATANPTGSRALRTRHSFA